LVFLQEKKTPLSELAQRLELDTLDTRFRYRPAGFTHPDSRIVIVDIDQKAQEVLGRWPFSRTYFAQMLDVLHEGGAAVAAFDVTFIKPDQTAAPFRSLIGRTGEESSYGPPEEVQRRLELFQKARALYCRRQWQTAQDAFQAILDQWPDDGPSRAYWKRCQDYLFEEPPLAWDGVFTMTHK
jgi:TolA-binding protein